MKKIKITVMRITQYADLMAQYENYELGSFSEEAKHAWRDEHWEEDSQRAYDAGRKMAE